MQPIVKPGPGPDLPWPVAAIGNTVAGELVEPVEQRDEYADRRRDRRH